MKGWHHESNRHALAARGIKTNIPGGLAEKVYPDLDPSEWVKGIEVELEHTNDINIAAEIALDHLSEDPDYYTKLIEWEQEFKANAVSFKPGPRGSSSTVSYVCNTQVDIAISNILDAKSRIEHLPEGDPRIPVIVEDTILKLTDMRLIYSTVSVDDYHYNKFVDIIVALAKYVDTGVLLEQPYPDNDFVLMVVDGAAYSLERSLGWRRGDHR